MSEQINWNKIEGNYVPEIKVIIEIYRVTELEKKDICYKRLFKLLPSLLEGEILHSTHILSDWGLIKSYYGETKKGWTGRKYKIVLPWEIKQWYDNLIEEKKK